ncbi:MAG: hypothetical protein WC289_04580 [Patescibacteria group bacterium]
MNIIVKNQQKVRARIHITGDQFSIHTRNYGLFSKLRGILRPWFESGIPAVIGKHGLVRRSIVLRRTKILPGDPEFVQEVIRHLRAEKWIARVYVEEDVERARRIEHVREKMIENFRIPSLRPYIVTILNNLHKMTDEQLEEVQKEVENKGEKG